MPGAEAVRLITPLAPWFVACMLYEDGVSQQGSLKGGRHNPVSMQTQNRVPVRQIWRDFSKSTHKGAGGERQPRFTVCQLTIVAVFVKKATNPATPVSSRVASTPPLRSRQNSLLIMGCPRKGGPSHNQQYPAVSQF